MIIKKHEKNVCTYVFLDDGVTLNAATGFLDASPVYDGDACRHGYPTMVRRSRSGRLESIPCHPRFVVKTSRVCVRAQALSIVNTRSV